MNITSYIVDADIKLTVKNGTVRLSGYAVFPRKYKEIARIFLYMNHIRARIECSGEYCRITFG